MVSLYLDTKNSTMKTKSILLHFIFFVIVALELIGTINGSKWLDYPVKPLILIWIGAYFIIMTKPQPYRWLVLTAFFFSWVGDLLLMFGWKSDLFFFSGVGGFFLSQVAYIFAFYFYLTKQGQGFLVRNPIWILPFLLYLIGIYGFLYPYLDGIMKPVVALYAISLLGMSAAAFNRKGLMDNRSFWVLFSGSLFFLISDSLLAINKFATPIPHEGFLVMSTYMAAQYQIMMGLMEPMRKKI
jgi:uncharacterized membrane protein YhhN